MANLPRGRPADQGVDPAAVLAFLDAVDADPAVELHSLMVLRHGRVVAEGWWAPHTPERTRLLYSLSKSFTSTALALAVGEGLVRLDDTVLSHLPELAGEITDPRSRAITLGDLASMAAGHDHDMWTEARALDPDEPVRGFLLHPPQQLPGSVFAYSQPCTYTMATVVQRRAGMPLSAYLQPRVLSPLGIEEVGWQCWPPGRELGFSGLFARTEDIAKLGQLYLQGGRWGERQLLPATYVEAATSPRVGTPAETNADWRQGYGYQFWMSRHGFRGDGAFGQFCLVLPEQDSVVAMTAGTEAMQAVLDHVWRHLLPGLGARPPSEEAYADLARRLRDLRLAPVDGRRRPSGAEDRASATCAITPPHAGSSATRFTSVTVEEADRGLQVTLEEPGNTLTFEAGLGDWSVTEPRDAHGDAVPVAASAGWQDDDTLEIQAIFLETPHRMDIVCTPPTLTAQASWRAAPQDGGRLETLHRPR